ncbi:MAG TPA: L-2-hydroxyglutarate oxidase [Candidatus Angelobacter sp.]
MDESFDITIVGAGIVGLAIGRELLKRYPHCRLLVLEKEGGVAHHQTGHNSGVIHSGIYYRPGSLKARLCVQGAAAMIEFARSNGIPFQQCGKVIVATTPDEFPRLEEIYRRGIENGVPGLRRLPDLAAIREIEPYSSGICGIHVGSTAITDFKMVAEAYGTQISSAGGVLRFNAQVDGIQDRSDETIVSTSAGEFRTKYLVNCAGLHSDTIARLAGTKLDMFVVPFRGEYYELQREKQHLVRGLIYPVPDPQFPFLGVHFTRRVHGGVEAGPNAVLALKREGYKKTSFSLKDSISTFGYAGFWKLVGRHWKHGLGEIHRSWSKAAFTRGLQKLLPELRAQDIRPSGAGVRAQAIDSGGKLVDDFYFVDSERATHVCNVPSPAATASLKIAEVVVDRIARQFSPHRR